MRLLSSVATLLLFGFCGSLLRLSRVVLAEPTTVLSKNGGPTSTSTSIFLPATASSNSKHGPATTKPKQALLRGLQASPNSLLSDTTAPPRTFTSPFDRAGAAAAQKKMGVADETTPPPPPEEEKTLWEDIEHLLVPIAISVGVALALYGAWRLFLLEPPAEAISRPKFWLPPEKKHLKMRNPAYEIDQALQKKLRDELGVRVTGPTGLTTSLPGVKMERQKRKAAQDAELSLILHLDAHLQQEEQGTKSSKTDHLGPTPGATLLSVADSFFTEEDFRREPDQRSQQGTFESLHHMRLAKMQKARADFDKNTMRLWEKEFAKLERKNKKSADRKARMDAHAERKEASKAALRDRKRVQKRDRVRREKEEEEERQREEEERKQAEKARKRRLKKRGMSTTSDEEDAGSATGDSPGGIRGAAILLSSSNSDDDGGDDDFLANKLAAFSTSGSILAASGPIPISGELALAEGGAGSSKELQDESVVVDDDDNFDEEAIAAAQRRRERAELDAISVSSVNTSDLSHYSPYQSEGEGEENEDQDGDEQGSGDEDKEDDGEDDPASDSSPGTSNPLAVRRLFVKKEEIEGKRRRRPASNPAAATQEKLGDLDLKLQQDEDSSSDIEFEGDILDHALSKAIITRHKRYQRREGKSLTVSQYVLEERWKGFLPKHTTLSHSHYDIEKNEWTVNTEAFCNLKLLESAGVFEALKDRYSKPRVRRMLNENPATLKGTSSVYHERWGALSASANQGDSDSGHGEGGGVSASVVQAAQSSGDGAFPKHVSLHEWASRIMEHLGIESEKDLARLLLDETANPNVRPEGSIIFGEGSKPEGHRERLDALWFDWRRGRIKKRWRENLLLKNYTLQRDYLLPLVNFYRTRVRSKKMGKEATAPLSMPEFEDALNARSPLRNKIVKRTTSALATSGVVTAQTTVRSGKVLWETARARIKWAMMSDEQREEWRIANGLNEAPEQQEEREGAEQVTSAYTIQVDAEGEPAAPSYALEDDVVRSQHSNFSNTMRSSTRSPSPKGGHHHDLQMTNNNTNSLLERVPGASPKGSTTSVFGALSPKSVAPLQGELTANVQIVVDGGEPVEIKVEKTQDDQVTQKDLAMALSSHDHTNELPLLIYHPPKATCLHYERTDAEIKHEEILREEARAQVERDEREARRAELANADPYRKNAVDNFNFPLLDKYSEDLGLGGGESVKKVVGVSVGTVDYTELELRKEPRPIAAGRKDAVQMVHRLDRKNWLRKRMQLMLKNEDEGRLKGEINYIHHKNKDMLPGGIEFAHISKREIERIIHGRTKKHRAPDKYVSTRGKEFSEVADELVKKHYHDSAAAKNKRRKKVRIFEDQVLDGRNRNQNAHLHLENQKQEEQLALAPTADQQHLQLAISPPHLHQPIPREPPLPPKKIDPPPEPHIPAFGPKGYLTHTSIVDVNDPLQQDPLCDSFHVGHGPKGAHMVWKKCTSSTVLDTDLHNRLVGRGVGAGSNGPASASFAQLEAGGARPAVYWVNLTTGQTEWDSARFPRDQMYFTDVR
ncbi:unnamed protein product [Amoebophrya sp. A25]|nr:unnamed protein product [Amoebophrya sp. A25]|eukprot:GSA25T00024270001.1